MRIEITRVLFEPTGGHAEYRIVDPSAPADHGQVCLEGEIDFVTRRGGPRPPLMDDTEVVTLPGGVAVYVIVLFHQPTASSGPLSFMPYLYRRQAALLIANMAVSASANLKSRAPTVIVPSDGEAFA